jgi:hypothetical protein
MTDVPAAARRERVFIALIALAAALRALLLLAAFPFFTNVDEHRHVDMALKYAGGSLPRPETAAYHPVFPRLLALYGTQEYVHPPDRPPAPPTWQLGDAVLQRRIERNRRHFEQAPNLENFQSPCYYAVAGTWLASARALGLDWGRALYAVRALGAVCVAALVVLAYALLRESHPDCAAVRLGAPALLAAAPLDVFHYVTPDSLAPLTGGIAFVLLLRCGLAPDRRPLEFALAGMATAAAFLTKSTLVVMVGLLLLASLRVARDASPSDARARGLRLGLLWAGLVLPVGVWLLRTLALTGSPLGTASKVAGLGWGIRPPTEWGAHPLFTPGGAWAFLSDLVPIFWRGELVWHRAVLALPAADACYGITTLVFGLAALALWRSRGRARAVEAASLLCVAGAVAVLAVLSLRFVFSETTNPPAHHPYFVQGRLVSGVWLPFAVLYTRGIGRLCSALPGAWPGRVAAALIAAVAAVAVGSELWLSLDVFASPYNFFHLPGADG